MPPTTLATRRFLQCLTSSMASCATCWASSRVGHSTKAPGTAALKLRGCMGFLRLARLGAASPLAAAWARWRSNSACSAAASMAFCAIRVLSTGSKKAAVLPEPVWLDTIKSMLASSALPLPMARGMALACTSVGWV